MLTQAVVGLGGVGKSTLARRWAHLHSAELSLGWWVRGEHPGTFEEDLLGLGRALGLLDANAAIEDRPAALDSIRAWLRSPTPLARVAAGQKRWLLIIDNAGDPASIDLPVGPGTVVVTSRDRRWERSVAGFKVDVLSALASRHLLQAGLAGPGNADADADALAAKLGHLPLALAQAHAWCHENGQPLARCLARLETPSSSVLRFPAGTGEATVASTWSLLVDGLAPTSRALLEVLAFFGSEDIPVESLFVEGLEKSVAGLSTELVSLCGNPDALDLALQPLHRMCLVERRGDRLDIHRLVQRVTRESLSEEGQKERLREAQVLLLRGMPEPQDPAGWPLWRRLVGHAEVLAVGEEPPVDDVLGKLATFFWTQAEYVAARRSGEGALAVTERRLGPDDLVTAMRLNNLAVTLSALGDHVAARVLKERALTITERTLGPHHPDTGAALYNLGVTLVRQGQPGAARPLMERALAIAERANGPNHPNTARSLGGLATTLGQLGDHQGARALHERALSVLERSVGPDHPSTSIQLGSLAQTLSALGDQRGARSLQERALAIREHVHGPDHPDTALCVNNLAATVFAVGDYGAALELQRRALSMTENALGAHHAATATCLGNLATTYSTLGELEAARPLHERALAITELSMGPQHLETAIRLYNFSATLFRLGEPAAARPLAERALAISERALGPNHPDTILRRTNLASILSALGGHAAGQLHPPSASPPDPTAPSSNRAARRAARKKR